MANSVDGPKAGENAERQEQAFRLRDITLSHISDFAYIFDHAGKFLYVNKPLLDLWGLTLEQAVGKNFFELNYPEALAAKLQNQIQQVFDTQKPVVDETLYTSPSGSPGYFEYIFSPVLAGDGRVELVAGSTRDITKRKRVELNLAFLTSIGQDLTRLIGADEMMRTIGAKIGEYLNLSLCAFMEIDDAERKAIVIHNWHRPGVPGILGVYNLAEFLTEDFQKAGRAGEIFIVRNTKTDPRTNAAGYDSLKINSFVGVPLVRDGKWRFLLGIYHSEPYDWLPEEIDLIRELTSRIWLRLERVRAENALIKSTEVSERQRRLYNTILSNTPDLVCVFGLDHRFTYANDALLKMWGRTWEDSVGKNCLELGYPAWHAALHDREIDQVIATKKPIRGEVPFNGTGGRRTYDYIFVPVVDANGDVEAITGTTRDVTDRRNAAIALAEAKDELQVANQNLEAKVVERTARLRESIAELETFSYSIAHDLRSPLRSLQGFGNFLSKEYGSKLDETGQDYLRRITASASRMDHLILDVLNYSKMARDELPLEPVNVNNLLSEIIDSYPMFRETGVKVHLKSPFEPVIGNLAALTQCFSNLLGNAIKFVVPGVKPEIQVWSESNAGRVKIFVRDNGIGIAADQQDKIFAIFQRVSKKYEGTGIGLAIVKKAAERMGGQVGVESEIGQGSTFWIELNCVTKTN